MLQPPSHLPFLPFLPPVHCTQIDEPTLTPNGVSQIQGINAGWTCQHHELTLHTNFDMEYIQREIRDLGSKVHLATSSALELDQVIEDTRRTPFTPRISITQIHDFRKVKLPSYKGTMDPKPHLTTFHIAVGKIWLEKGEEDARF